MESNQSEPLARLALIITLLGPINGFLICLSHVKRQFSALTCPKTDAPNDIIMTSSAPKIHNILPRHFPTNFSPSSPLDKTCVTNSRSRVRRHLKWRYQSPRVWWQAWMYEGENKRDFGRVLGKFQGKSKLSLHFPSQHTSASKRLRGCVPNFAGNRL